MESGSSVRAASINRRRGHRLRTLLLDLHEDDVGLARAQLLQAREVRFLPVLPLLRGGDDLIETRSRIGPDLCRLGLGELVRAPQQDLRDQRQPRLAIAPAELHELRVPAVLEEHLGVRPELQPLDLVA